MSSKLRTSRGIALVLTLSFIVASPALASAISCADCGRMFNDQYGCKCQDSCSAKSTCNLCCQNKFGLESGGGWDWEARRNKAVALQSCLNRCADKFETPGA